MRGKPLRSCHFPGCTRTAFVEDRCPICEALLCLEEHNRAKTHHCNALTSDERMAGWDLRREARQFALSQYGAADSCKLVLPSRKDDLLMGYSNIHIPVDFSDGTRWLARVKMDGVDNFSPLWQCRYVNCEIATLKFLNRIAPEFIPAAYDPHCRLEDDLRYILVEYVGGVMNERMIWHTTARNLVKGYAQFMNKVANHPLKGIGSLRIDHASSEPQVGPVLRLCSDEEDVGPFATLRDYYNACLDLAFAALEEGSMFMSTRGETERIDTYLNHLHMRHLVNACAEMADEAPTYITHLDQSSDTLRVGSDGELVGILDWEISGTMPAVVAFGCTPFFASPAFIDQSSNELSFAELELVEELEALGRHDLAHYVTTGRKHIRLGSLMGESLIPNSRMFGYVKGLLAAFGDAKEDIPDTIEEWRVKMEALYGDDEGLVRFKRKIAAEA